MFENKGGQIILIQLLFLFMTIAMLIALIPSLNQLINMAQQSDYLNCPGYYYNGDVNNTFSYNDSLPSNTMACLGIRLYLPYIILVVLIATISKLVAQRLVPQEMGFG